MAAAAAAASAALAALAALLFLAVFGGGFFSASFFFGSGFWVAASVVDGFDPQFLQGLLQAPVADVAIGNVGGGRSGGRSVMLPLPGGGVSVATGGVAPGDGVPGFGFRIRGMPELGGADGCVPVGVAEAVVELAPDAGFWQPHGLLHGFGFGGGTGLLAGIGAQRPQGCIGLAQVGPGLTGVPGIGIGITTGTNAGVPGLFIGGFGGGASPVVELPGLLSGGGPRPAVSPPGLPLSGGGPKPAVSPPGAPPGELPPGPPGAFGSVPGEPGLALASPGVPFGPVPGVVP